MSGKSKVRVLFVCMGNICRSPTAEGVFRRVLAARAPELQIEIDSAGTHDYHVGSPPDRRAVEAAHRRGVDLSALRARMVSAEDFTHYDLILAMDEENLRELKRRAQAQRTTLADLVNRLLRRSLQGRDDGRAPRRRYRERTLSLGQPALDLDKALALAAALEDDEILEKKARRK